MRLKMKTPGGRNYRLACARESEDLRVDMGREYPTLFGNKIDIIGKLEDMHPLECYLILSGNCRINNIFLERNRLVSSCIVWSIGIPDIPENYVGG